MLKLGLLGNKTINISLPSAAINAGAQVRVQNSIGANIRVSGGPISIHEDGYNIIHQEGQVIACVYDTEKNIYVPFRMEGKIVILENTRPPTGDIMVDSQNGQMYVCDGKKWIKLVAN